MNPDLPLRDIHLPEPVSWWPPAPGWWLLLVLIIAAGLWLFRIYRSRQRKRTFVKTIEQQLQAIHAAFQQHQDSQQLAQDLSVLIRRAALSVAPRDQVAGQIGEQWLQQLDELAEKQLFNTETGRQLVTAPYQPAARTDAEGLLNICREWLQLISKKRVAHADI
jgi:uncharacterized membrane protein YccC